MKSLRLKSLLVGMLAISCSQLTSAEPVAIKEVLKTTKSWNGENLPGYSSGTPELRVLSFKIAPGAKTALHVHPYNGAGYMLAGELTMYVSNDPHGSFADPTRVKEIKLTPGDAWAETVNSWHYGINKGKVDVEFIVIFAGEEGTPPTLSLGTKLPD